MISGAVGKSARAAIERMYDGRCAVYAKRKTINSVTQRTEFAEVELYADKPCRLSFSSGRSLTGGGAVAEVAQSVKLFVAPELSIPDGSKIVITQNGIEEAYSNSGAPSRYATHQEIQLSLFEKWA